MPSSSYYWHNNKDGSWACYKKYYQKKHSFLHPLGKYYAKYVKSYSKYCKNASLPSGSEDYLCSHSVEGKMLGDDAKCRPIRDQYCNSSKNILKGGCADWLGQHVSTDNVAENLAKAIGSDYTKLKLGRGYGDLYKRVIMSDKSSGKFDKVMIPYCNKYPSDSMCSCLSDPDYDTWGQYVPFLPKSKKGKCSTTGGYYTKAMAEHRGEMVDINIVCKQSATLVATGNASIHDIHMDQGCKAELGVGKGSAGTHSTVDTPGSATHAISGGVDAHDKVSSVNTGTTSSNKDKPAPVTTTTGSTKGSGVAQTSKDTGGTVTTTGSDEPGTDQEEAVSKWFMKSFESNTYIWLLFIVLILYYVLTLGDSKKGGWIGGMSIFGS